MSLKTRYFTRLSYKGTQYHGWQIQPNALTVQQVLNEDFSLLLGQKVQLTGCGRTDTGVHARIFYAHFDVNYKLAGDQDFLFRINNKLPADIAIHEILPVRADAHARFDAISRTYEYKIRRRKDVFNTDLSHYIYGEMDFESMQRASDMLKEFTDFTSFSKVDTDTKTNNCKIYQACWDITDDHLVFRIQADRFLRNMVRAIVGTLLEVGSRRTDLVRYRHIIENRNRSDAGTSAPARGLFLADVEYPPGVFKPSGY